MRSSLEDRVGAALAAWVDRVVRHPRVTLALALVLASAAGLYSASQLGVESNTDELFRDDLPLRVNLERMRQAFPAIDEDLLVVIDAPTRVEAENAVRALASRMRSEPEYFESVSTPGVGPFFDRNGLLYLDVDELEELADHLAAAQPFLAEVAGDPSLRGLFKLLTRLVERDGVGGSEGPDVAALFDAVAATLGDAERLLARRQTFGDLILGGEADASGDTRRFAIVRPRLHFDEFVAAGEALPRLSRIVDELGYGIGSETRARITGEIALQSEELDRVQRQAALAGVASFLLVAAILAFGLRSPRVIFSTLAALTIGLACTFGFATLTIGHLNLISVAFAVLFIGLGVDFGIHFGSRYQEIRAEGVEHATALSETARTVGSSLFLCALTTAIGFFAFTPTGYVGVAELGVIAGFGMLISLLATVTILPACLSVGLGRGSAPRAVSTVVSLPTFPARYPGRVCAAAAALALVGFAIAPRWHFDSNPLRVRDPGAESVQTFEELIDGGNLNPWSIDVLVSDLAGAERLAARLRELPSVASASTILDLVPGEQEQKLEILADVSFFLEPALSATPQLAPTAGEGLQALGAFRSALESADFDSAAAADAATGLAAALDRFLDSVPAHGGEPIALLEDSLVDPLVDALGRLRVALGATPVTLADLPPELLVRSLTRDGRARIEVRPSESLNDATALRRFVRDVTAEAPRATGSAVFILESTEIIVSSLIQALSTAIVLVAVLLLLLWRSVADAALALTPLLLAALLTAAVAVAIGLPVNFADVIVLPLLLGIGVDSGIHLVHRYRRERGPAVELLRTSTSRAVLWSALTTIASFGSLAFASHRGMASLGQLLTIGVVLTLLCNLIVLPALIALVARRTARADLEGRPKG